MDASDNPGFLFRKTSLTIRLRFTPAMACSTRTRSFANLRLTCFSAAVSSRPRGFFFRLASLRHRRLIPLKPCVLIQGGTGWIRQVFLIGDPLVMGLTGIRLAEEQNLLIRGAGHEYVLVRGRFLLAAIVEGLFFGVFWPLPPPFRTVDDDDPGTLGRGRTSRQPTAVSLRQNAPVIQGRAQHREEVMEPVVRLGGTNAEGLTQHHLERVGLQVNQDEQQLVRAAGEGAGSPAALPPLPRLTSSSSIARVGMLVSGLESRQEIPELSGGQAGHREKRSRLSR